MTTPRRAQLMTSHGEVELPIIRLDQRDAVGYQDDSISLITSYNQRGYLQDNLTFDGRSYLVTDVNEDIVTGVVTIRGRVLFKEDEIVEQVREMIPLTSFGHILSPYISRWNNMMTGARTEGSRPPLRFTTLVENTINSNTHPTLDQLMDILLNYGLQLHFAIRNQDIPPGFPRREFSLGWVGITPIGYVFTEKDLPTNVNYENLRMDARFFNGLFNRKMGFSVTAPSTSERHRIEYIGGTDSPTEYLREFPSQQEGVIALEARRLRDMYLRVATIEAELPYDPSWEVHDGVKTEGLPHDNWYVREIQHTIGGRDNRTRLFLNARPSFTLEQLVQGSPEPFNSTTITDFYGEVPSRPIVNLIRDSENNLLRRGGLFAFDIRPGEFGNPVTKYNIKVSRRIDGELVEEIAFTVNEKGLSNTDAVQGEREAFTTILYADSQAGEVYQVETTAVNKNGSGVASTISVVTPSAMAPEIYPNNVFVLPKAQETNLEAIVALNSLTDEQSTALDRTIYKYDEEFSWSGDTLVSLDVSQTHVIVDGMDTSLSSLVGKRSILGDLSVGPDVEIGPETTSATLELTEGALYTLVTTSFLQELPNIALDSSFSRALEYIRRPAIIAFRLVPELGSILGTILFVGNIFFTPKEHGVVWIITANGDGEELNSGLDVQWRERSSTQGSWSAYSNLDLRDNIGVDGAFNMVVVENELGTQKTWAIFDPLEDTATGQRQYRFRVETTTNSEWLETRIINLSDFTRIWLRANASVLHEPTYLDM